jgi:predicted metal-binding protein
VTVDCPAYTIHVCDRCGGDGNEAGAALMRRLASCVSGDGVRLSSVRCMAGCERPLVVAFSAPDKASFLFGDIDPAQDVEALLSFGMLYASLDDGWCNEGSRPQGLRGKTIARIPRSMGSFA